MVERAADDLHAKVLKVFKRCDLDGNGTIDHSEFKAALQRLEPKSWTNSDVDCLFEAIDVGSDGLIQFEEMLAWLYEKPGHRLFKLAADPGAEDDWGDDAVDADPVDAAMSSHTTLLEAATSEDVTEVEVIWSDSSGATQSLLLDEVSLHWTLAVLKKRCCELLGVVSVHAEDFNEDMNGRTLLELGIGTSGLPFAIIRGEAAAEMSRSSCPAAALARPVPVRAKASAAGAGARKAPSPLKQRQAKADASEIYEGWLFLGGNLAAGDRAALQELGVTHVINCCDRIPCRFKKTFTYLSVSVFDTKSSDIRKHFPEALDFIDRAHAEGGGCLVHCMVGASRSTSIVLAWLISRCKIPLLQAFREVKARRGCARPNRSFCEQLMEFEEEVLGSRSAVLADFGHT